MNNLKGQIIQWKNAQKILTDTHKRDSQMASKHRESCSDSQSAEKYKIIVTIRYHYTRVRAAKMKMTKY